MINQFRFVCSPKSPISLVQILKKLSSTSAGGSVKSLSNKKCNYTIEEITIPSGTGIVAGQVWKGEESTSAKELPPIICTHGTLDNLASFHGLLPLIMKPNMTVLCVDFPGHGLSSHLTSGHYDGTVDGCKTILRAYTYFGSPKAILMGHSHGAVSSLLFSAVYPELTDRLIAIDFHPLSFPDPVPYVKYMMERQINIDEKLAKGKSVDSLSYEDILQKLYQGRQKTVSWKACERLLQRGAKKLPDGKFVFSHDLRATIAPAGRFSMEDWKKFVAAVKCPVTVIKAQPGDAGGFGIPGTPRSDNTEELVEEMKKHNDNVQLHFVPGTHFVHMNEPDLIAPLISAALR